MVTVGRWSQQNLLPLSFNFFVSKRVSTEIENPATRSLQPQALILWEKKSTLKLSKILVRFIRQHRHNLAANSSKEVTRLPRIIGGSSNEEVSEFISSVLLIHLLGFLARNLSTSRIPDWLTSTRVCSCLDTLGIPRRSTLSTKQDHCTS